MLINLRNKQASFNDIMYQLNMSTFRQFSDFKSYQSRSWNSISRGRHMLNFSDPNELLFRYLTYHYKDFIELTP